MKGLCRIALAALVAAACGGDAGITAPVAPNAPSSGGGILAIGMDSVTGATIETNKDDYSPGEVVHVAGRGWAPGETVNLHMTEEPNTHADVDTNVVADSAGAFSIHYYDVQRHDVGVTFTLTATGSTSHSKAVAIFTDGDMTGLSVNESDCSTVSSSFDLSDVVCAVASISGNTNENIRFTWTRPDNSTQTTTVATSGPNGGKTASATITANQVGNWSVSACKLNPQSDCAGTTYTANFTVGTVSVPTTTTIGSSADPSVTGQTVTFTATVKVTATNAAVTTGTVTFRLGGTDCSTATVIGSSQSLNGSGQATETRSFLATEDNSTIRACYSGASGFDASSGDMVQNVDKANVSVSVSDNPTSSNVGQSVTFTATIAAAAPGSGTPTGTVKFYEFAGSESCSSPPVSALATDNAAPYELGTSSLTAGNHTITACYLGDANFNAGSGFDTHSVSLVGTTTTITSLNNPSVTGQSTTYTATVKRTSDNSNATGNVTFKTGGTSCSDAAPLSGPTALVAGQAQAGPYSYTATQTGLVVRACFSDGGVTFADSEDDLTQVVNKANTSATATDSNDPSVFGQSITLGTTVTAVAPGGGTPTGSVKYWELTGGDCASPVGTQLGTTQALSGAGTASVNYSGLSVGSHTITVCYLGDDNYNPSSNTTTHQVNKAQSQLTLTTNSPTYFGNSATFTATMSVEAPGAGTPSGTVRFYDGGTCNTTTGLGTGTLLDTKAISGGSAIGSTTTLNAGAYTIVACYGGDANFLGDSDSQSHTVNPAPTQTTLSSNPDPSVFGNGVTFTATVAVTAGAGIPTGTVTFYVGGASCGAGTSLGSDAVDGTGVAEITNVVNAALTQGTHTVRACYAQSGGNFVDSEDTDSHTVSVKPTTTVASVTTLSPQYSDEINLKAVVTPYSLNGQELTGNVRFYFGASAVSCPASDPGAAGTDVIASDDIVDADNGIADDADYAVSSPAGNYKVTACFYSTNSNFGHSGDDGDVAIETEDASVTPAAPPAYGNAFPIGGTGSANFSLQFVVREINAEPDANAGALAGDIDNTSLTVNLNAVSSGANNASGSCTKSADVAGASYAHTAVFTCSFTNVAVDAYEVVAAVGGVAAGSFYDGGYIDVLTVYDPNAGFVTGGGKIEYPDASKDRVNFGLSFKLNANKPRGNLLVIRHLANGDVCRGKSNDIGAPAVSGNTASFSGKGNYGCTRPDGTTYDGAGNQNITGWVEDNGQGTNATSPDRFWIRVAATNSKLLMANTASANAQPLTGGNIQVPQPGGGR